MPKPAQARTGLLLFTKIEAGLLAGQGCVADAHCYGPQHADLHLLYDDVGPGTGDLTYSIFHTTATDQQHINKLFLVLGFNIFLSLGNILFLMSLMC